MTVKEQILQTIEALPEDVDWRSAREKIDFMAAVQEGLDELNAGESIPVEQVEKELQAWLAG